MPYMREVHGRSMSTTFQSEGVHVTVYDFSSE